MMMFSDNTSLFYTVSKDNKSADELQSDLEKVRFWAWQ